MALSTTDSLDAVSLSSFRGEVEVVADISDSEQQDHSKICLRCRLLDFGYVGWHESDTDKSNGYLLTREYSAIVSSAAYCHFCDRIVSITRNWFRTRTTLHLNHLDLPRAGVDVKLETDWHELKTAKSGKGIFGHYVRIKIHLSIPAIDKEESGKNSKHLTFFIQRMHNGEEMSATEVYTGRQRPLIADLRLFKQWKYLCDKHHGKKCTTIFQMPERITPRLIDVQQRCLVDASKDDTWICLSYVWGQARTLRLSKSNAADLYKPGSLTPTNLPNIVEDAVRVSTGLGERYLWVDALCIIQDDDQDKARFVSRMDSIYACATVVIVAATCVDSNSMLPGVRSGTRQSEPSPFVIQGISLVQSLDPVDGIGIDLRTGRSGAYLGTTIWDTRAWTLQERFLASRCLVFTDEQIFWECEETFCCEDSFREIPYIIRNPRRTSLCGGELDLVWSTDGPVFDHYYRTLLEEYSCRAMTNESDGLNAFSGIIRAFESTRHEQFYCGLPCAYLESALAWGHPFEHKLKRRQGDFPSWSWTGWVGDGTGKLNNQSLHMQRVGLEFYRFVDKEAEPERLKQSGTQDLEYDLLAEGSHIPARGQRCTAVTKYDLLPDLFTRSYRLLAFWTACATLKVKRTSPLSTRHGSRDAFEWETIMAQGDLDIRVSWSQMPLLHNEDEIEVIAVAQNRGNWDGGHIANGAIGVMVLSWLGGVAHREGFAWIAIRDWTSLAGRSWKLVVLD